MRHIPTIAGILLGLAFIAGGAMFLLNLMPPQTEPPEGSLMAAFFAAFAPSGYLHFVKVCEIVGGVLVAIPLTRNLGLLILGPILVNIIAFHVFITKGEGLTNPVVIGLAALALFLLVIERKAFWGLIRRPS